MLTLRRDFGGMSVPESFTPMRVMCCHSSHFGPKSIALFVFLVDRGSHLEEYCTAVGRL